MTADQFVTAIRKGDEKFRVSKITLKAEGQIIRGQGSLSVVGDDFKIDLEVAQRYNVPEPQRELWKPADAWKISGLIEGALKFTSDWVSPQGHSRSWVFGRKSGFIQHLRLDRINLVPMGFDALSEAKRARILQRPRVKRAKYPDVEFHAVLFDCEPVFLNAGTDTKVRNDFLGAYSGGSALDTFLDRGREYDFALIKKDGDTHIHFRSKSQFHSVSEQDDRRRFQALLMGVGFTHGFQPWPYRIQFWRGGRKVTDQFRPPYKLTRTRYAPFDKGIGFQRNLHRKGAQNSVVRLAAEFFGKQTTLSQEVSRLLFLFRETGSASFRVKTLALCSLFEGAVNLIFDGLRLEDEFRRSDPQFDEYLQLRSRLVRRLRRIAANRKSQALGRIAGSIGAGREFRVQDKFKAICRHFGLSYDGEMSKHYEAWNRKRNPFMHGNWKEEDTDFSDQSLIAGAINIIVLKGMGFSGQMKANDLAYDIEDRYRKI
jgi:hypothetical protein